MDKIKLTELAKSLNVPLPGSVDLKVWIEEQIRQACGVNPDHDLKDCHMSGPAAADLALAAALYVIFDKETLIGNLRSAGYVVIAPRPGKPEEKTDEAPAELP